jgi:hypothetical protein
MRMESEQLHEEFETGLKKIGHEIKSQLVLQGLFGTIKSDRSGSLEVPEGARVEIHAKGRVVGLSFDRKQIEGCSLRVTKTVMAAITALIEELAAAIRSGSVHSRSP